MTCHRRFRTFNEIDNFKQENVHIAVDSSINSACLVPVFVQTTRDHGLPKGIRMVNGPELFCRGIPTVG